MFEMARSHGAPPCDTLVGCMLAAAVQLGRPFAVLKVWEEVQASGAPMGLRAHANLVFSLARCAASQLT